ncbi:MAG: O-antigen ligase family protein [Saprospiraceae bacterium]|nr:O-antigen ligase family protein [Saprospiraceae bacterium]
MRSLMSNWKENLGSWHLLQWAFALGLVLVATGISWSVFLVSNSVIVLSLLIPFMCSKNGFIPKINVLWKQDFGEMLQEPLLLSMMLFWATQFISGYWSDLPKDWIWFSRMQLPFLLLPFVFYRHAYLTSKLLYAILGIFIVVCFISSLYIGFDYLQNADFYNLQLLKGKPFVTHISHIRYSMLIAMCALICLHIFFTNLNAPKIWTKVGLLLCIYFFSFNHLLSAKTGLFSMYLAIIAYMFSGLPAARMQTKLFLMLSLLGITFLSYYMLPSLQQKIYYTWWQIGEFSRGKWLNYSDIERWMSIQMGLEMIKQEPFFGCGIGDLYKATANIYQECLSNENYKLPHNQFIFTWAFTGIFGFLSLLSILYFSALQKTWWRHPLIISIQVILWSSFFVEYTLGTQIGCSLYVFSTLLSWGYLRKMTA